MSAIYPVLAGEIAKRGIKKSAIAKGANMCHKSFTGKMNGKSPFSLPEAISIRDTFFPDIALETLFSKTQPPTP